MRRDRPQVEVPWPVHGISEDMASAKQRPLTTPYAKNVRTITPGTGRAQGSQRPGYSNFTTAALRAGKPVDALTSVTVDLPKQEFLGPDRSQIVRKWGHVVPGLREALALDVDRDGNLYVLDASGVFEKIGPDGEVEATQTIYVPNQEALVPRIQVDTEGNVYVAVSSPVGFSGRVIRFNAVEPPENDDDEGVIYEEAWKVGGFYGIRDFRVRLGGLAISRFYSEQEEGAAPADLAVYGALFAPEPVLRFEEGTPWPVSTIDINESGDVLGCCPANPDRVHIIGEDEWVAPIEEWSPHETEDASGYGAAKTLYSWLDAGDLASTHVDGAWVRLIPDRRWLDTTLDFSQQSVLKEANGVLTGGLGGPYLPPTDTVARRLAIDTNSTTGKSTVFRPKGAGAHPAIEFTAPPDARAGFQTKRSLANQGVKTDTDIPLDGSPNDDGRQVGQVSLVPNNHRACYAMFLAIRYVPSNTNSSVLWHHRGPDGAKFVLVLNAKSTDVYADGSPTNGPSEGHMTFYVGDENGNARVGNATTVTNTPIQSVDLQSSDFDNPQKVAIICIQHAGVKGGAGPSTTFGESLFRVNGRTVEKFTMTHAKVVEGQTFLGKMAHAGLKYWRDKEKARLGDLWDISDFVNGQLNFGHFKGHMMTALTVLGTTSTATDPNVVPVTWPGQPSGATAPATGLTAGVPAQYQYTNMATQNYGSDPLAYTSFASVIERIEGWIAYKLGCPNVLQGGTPGVSGNFQDTHPFGLTAAGDAQYPVGSPGAGGGVLSDADVTLLSTSELLFKIGASGGVAWALEGNGHGLGVKAGIDRTVLAVGRHGDGSTVVAKRVVDNGNSVRTTGLQTWEVEDESEPSPVAVMGLDVDNAGNLYWPREDETKSIRMTWTANPSANVRFRLSAGNAGDPANYWYYEFQAAAPTSDPDYTWVDIGTSKEQSLANIIAAINDTGTADQYAAQSSVQAGPNPDWVASLETDGSASFLRLTRTGRAAQGGAHTEVPTAFYWDDYPSDTEFSFFSSPYYLSLTVGAAAPARLEVRGASDGALLWSKTYPGTGSQTPLAIALDPDTPLYPDGDPLEDFPEHVYVAQRNNVDTDGETLETPTGDNVQKLRQVQRRQVIGKDKSPRKTCHLATCNGDFFVVAKGKKPALVNNGSGVFDPASPFAKLWSYQQLVYGLDGESYIKFNPKTRLVEEWKADGAGKIPYGAKLACVWNGRIVLGRTPDAPHNVFMSGRGNPDDWDFSPPVITPLSAFSGSSAGNLHFENAQPVNCLIPVSDQMLIMGMPDAITRLTGDPGTGGDLDLITDGEGLAFGAPWAKDPEGVAYVKGTKGGVWRIAAGQLAGRISEGWIEERLQNVNLSEYDILMEWSLEQEGLHVYQVPKGVGQRIVAHWFWDRKQVGWWEDEFSATGLQPTSVALLGDDNPQSQVLAIGCEDGWIRYEDGTATNDGGQRIVSEVIFGPLVPPNHSGRAKFSRLDVVTTTDSDPLTIEVFTDEVSDVVAGRDPVYQGEAGPGWKGTNMIRASGNQAWIKAKNGALGQTWALETMHVQVDDAGRKRRR